MPLILLETHINAPIERVFDLSRSIDLHKLSTGNTKEEAVAGRLSGLIELNETVTWRATHLGIRQYLTTKISSFNRPFEFTDEMVKGAFQSMVHSHRFKSSTTGTFMTDHFQFKAPFGLVGKLAEAIFLKNYMKGFLVSRNKMIKDVAESNSWNQFL